MQMINFDKNKFNSFFKCSKIQSSQRQKPKNYERLTKSISYSKNLQEYNRSKLNKTFQTKNINKEIPFDLINTAIPLKVSKNEINLIQKQIEQKHPISDNERKCNINRIQQDDSIIEFYKKNIFDIPLKFKRFTNILKQKFNTINNKQKRKQKPKQTSREIDKYQNRMLITALQLGRQRDNTQFIATSYTPKPISKGRPSSGTPLIQGNRFFLKKRKSMSTTYQYQSLDFKHIDALTYPDASPIHSDSKRAIVFKSKKTKRRPAQGNEEDDKINGWQYEIDKQKNIQDTEVQVRLYGAYG